MAESSRNLDAGHIGMVNGMICMTGQILTAVRCTHGRLVLEAPEVYMTVDLRASLTPRTAGPVCCASSREVVWTFLTTGIGLKLQLPFTCSFH